MLRSRNKGKETNKQLFTIHPNKINVILDVYSLRICTSFLKESFKTIKQFYRFSSH